MHLTPTGTFGEHRCPARPVPARELCVHVRTPHAVARVAKPRRSTWGSFSHRYQNALTAANSDLFDVCDGIFTNYWWGPQHLAQSLSLAGPKRQFDVFVGVDCFARNTTYAAGTACAAPCRATRQAGLSLALFAPGWSVECGEAAKCDRDEDAAAADQRFWAALGVAALFR